MTQEGIVTQTFANNTAEVAVTRMTACGGNCGSCETCMLQSELKTVANNLVGAEPGQRVVIESKSSAVLGAVFLVYVMPLALFLAGYALSYAAGLGEGVCIVSSFVGLAVGALLLILSQRGKKKKTISYDIVRLI